MWFLQTESKQRERKLFVLFSNVSWQAIKNQSSKYGIKWITIAEIKFCLLYLNVSEDFHHLICPVSLATAYLTFECTRL